MPSRWWESEPRDAASRREGRSFRASAERMAFRRQARNELRSRGMNPDLFPQLSTSTGPLITGQQAGAIQPDTESKGGGILGKISGAVTGAVDDVSSAVFRGKVREPWDVLRPFKQLLDLQYKTTKRGYEYFVEEPLISSYRGGRQAFLGESREEAERKTREYQANIEAEPSYKVFKELAVNTAFDPTFYLGAGEISAVTRFGARTAAKLPVLDALFTGVGSRAALKGVLAGGAGESPEMEKIISSTRGTPLDTYGVRTVGEVLDYTRQNLSQTEYGRYIIGNLLPRTITNWLEGRGVRLIDDVGLELNEYGRVKSFGHNAGSVGHDLRRAAFRKAFQLDGAGRVLDLPGQPYIDDVVANFLDYKLNVEQLGAIRLHRELNGLRRGVEAASGVPIKDLPTPRGVYVHLEPIGRPVVTEGVEETMKVGPPVREKFGSKQSFEKPRSYSTKSEGITHGVEYMDFFDAQRARDVQGYNRIADKWLTAALRPYGFSATELLAREAPDLLKQGTSLAQRVRKLQSLEREATIAKRVGSRWAFRIPTKLVDEDLVGIANRAKEASGLPKKAGRQASLAGIQDEVRGLLKQTRGELQPIKARRTTIMRRISAGGTEEFPKNFRGRFYAKNIGERLSEFDSPGPSGLLENTVNKFNNLIRPLMATLDASFMGVQGLLGSAHNPKAYVKALQYAFTSAYDERIAAHQASGLLDTYLKSGGHFAARNDIGEFLFGGWVEKVPGVGWGARKSNTWFTRFGNGLRLEMFDSAAKIGTHTEKDLQGLARMVNLSTGYTGGKATSIETAMLFAPRFFRSQIGLVSDAITRRSLGGNEAAAALSKLIVGGVALTYSLNEVLGNPTEFNPSSPNFLRIRALNRDISVFGPWDSLVRAIYIGATNPIQGISYIARTKASPAIARIYDLIQGHTIAGDELKWGNAEEVVTSLGLLGKQMGPISLGQSVEQGVPSSLEELGASAIQFAGTKASPLTAYEQLANRRNSASQSTFQKDWPELEQYQRFELEKSHPELKRPKASTDVGRGLEARRVMLETFTTQQQALDSAGMPGPEWRAEYQRINASRAGAFDQWERDNPEAAGFFQVPDNPGDLALQQQREAFKAASNPWGGIDPEKLTLLLNDLDDSWTPEQKAFVERNTGYHDTPLVKEYKSAIRTLKPYFELEDSVWNTARQNSPELSPYQMVDDYVFSIVQGLVQQGHPIEQAASVASDLPVVKQIEAVVSDLRERYRFANPDADSALAKWFGATPIFMQRRGRHKRRRF